MGVKILTAPVSNAMELHVLASQPVLNSGIEGTLPSW